MPYSVNIDDSLSLVIARLWGTLDDENLVEYFEELERRGPFDEGFDLLLVIDEQADLVASGGSIRESARRMTTFKPNALRVIVATDTLAYGISRIYVSTASKASGQYRMARSLGEAAGFLDAELEQLTQALKTYPIN